MQVSCAICQQLVTGRITGQNVPYTQLQCLSRHYSQAERRRFLDDRERLRADIRAIDDRTTRAWNEAMRKRATCQALIRQLREVDRQLAELNREESADDE